MIPSNQSGSTSAISLRTALRLSPTLFRLLKLRTLAITQVESVRCLPPAWSQPCSRQTCKIGSSKSSCAPCSTRRSRKSTRILASKPSSSSGSDILILLLVFMRELLMTFSLYSTLFFFPCPLVRTKFPSRVIHTPQGIRPLDSHNLYVVDVIKN